MPLQEHILQFIDWYEEAGNPEATLLITGLCAHGNLQGFIDKALPNMGVRDILHAVAQVASALEHLHDKGLYHTDVKPRNILVRGLKPLDAVLADCADVRRLGAKGPLRGSPQYYSPEMLQHKRHCGAGDDVWALGVTLAGMLAQWPQLSRRGHDARSEVRKWPHRCQNHAQKLLALNPRSGVVRMLVGMLAWELDERWAAAACAEQARALLLETAGVADDDCRLGITAPDDFLPLSFW